MYISVMTTNAMMETQGLLNNHPFANNSGQSCQPYQPISIMPLNEPLSQNSVSTFSKMALNGSTVTQPELILSVSSDVFPSSTSCHVSSAAEVPRDTIFKPSLDNRPEELKMHRCQYPGCLVSCKTGYDLQRHAQRHLGSGQFECNMCFHKFQRFDELKRHVFTHTGERPFKCPHCDFRCIQSYDLVKHQYLHTHEKPFKCFTCNKSFTRATRLKLHAKLHSGDRPLICNFCGRDFVNKRTLNAHIIKHQPPTTVQPEETDVVSLTQSVSKPFKCNVCSKHFMSFLSLKRHLGFHAKRVHVCDICKKSFPTKLEVDAHFTVSHQPYHDSFHSFMMDTNFESIDRSISLFDSSSEVDQPVTLGPSWLSLSDQPMSNFKEKSNVLDHKNPQSTFTEECNTRADGLCLVENSIDSFLGFCTSPTNVTFSSFSFLSSIPCHPCLCSIVAPLLLISIIFLSICQTIKVRPEHHFNQFNFM